ncbi:cell number regulator 2 [Physcomitrium patens]|uniref:Uncharacterized protein n=1 Tax=Physcomitrium patens TaxID=3218 RepID=A9RYB4_PHYPA|nr:cell number regulator 2-like [Physcomitrium patens]PNR49248.1 hypothetical protein PHYPA_011144 [Physcomitrium patens]|eukprot:XP_024382263.1 cell number regulator 2-like [Physcomitrella patens]
MAYTQTATAQWNSGLCDCFQDCGSFCCSFCCPCVVVGRLAEIIDQGMTSCIGAGCIFYCLQTFTGLGCLYTCGYRARLRAKYGLVPEPCGDCCVDCWCLSCSLSQQHRELQSRGINPSLGWLANREAYEKSAPAPQRMGGY